MTTDVILDVNYVLHSKLVDIEQLVNDNVPKRHEFLLLRLILVVVEVWKIKKTFFEIIWYHLKLKK